jgi:two-component system, cell cycle sensor histidine kinase and response regulator CckA
MINLDDLKGATVFVVDDTPENLRFLSDYLKRYQMIVVPIRSGAEVLKLIESRSPDIILLDIMMPEMDGYETCRRIKEIEEVKNIPVIFMSALSETVDKVKGFDLGAVDYITKPIDPEESLYRISTHLTISRLQKKLHEANISLEKRVQERTRELSITNDALLRENKERKRTEKELLKIYSAVKQSPASVIITDNLGTIDFVNPKFTEMTGYTAEEVQGRNLQFLNSDDMPPENFNILLQEIAEDNQWNGEFRARRKNGKHYWESAMISPIKDLDGTITHYLKVSEDITQRKALENQLLQAQKMDSLGRLAGGIAHDFNNLLTSIIGYTELIKLKRSEDKQIQKFIDQVLRASTSAKGLIQQILAFSRKALVQPQILNLNNVIENFRKMLYRILGADIDLQFLPVKDLGNIKADPQQIEQIVLNLVVNARDAMPNGGKVVIETHNTELDTTYSTWNPGVKAGNYVLLSVTDTGCGMDKETTFHIFEPFFTTKEKGVGTGLGLSTVYGIVQQSGGHLNVYSEVGIGTSFKIYFPREYKEEEIQEAAINTDYLGGDETIMVVEDEENVLSLTVNILEEWGYKVYSAGNATQAVELWKNHQNEIDLLLTDIVMPGKSGLELAKILVKTKPHLMVVFMTGYSESIFASSNPIGTNFHCIQKPFMSKDLAITIRNVLDSKDSKKIQNL